MVIVFIRSRKQIKKKKMNNLTGVERQVLCRKYIQRDEINYYEASQKVDKVVIFLANLKTKLAKNSRLTSAKKRLKFDEEKEKIWREMER